MIKSYRIDLMLLSITRSRYDIGITLNSVNLLANSMSELFTKRSFAQNIFDTLPNAVILRFLKKTHICYGDF